MPCPRWSSTATTKRQRRTALGYPRFNCRACGRRFHERTGPPFNDLQDPTDIVRRAVLGRLRYTLRFRAVVALLLERGFGVTHETIRNWACRGAPLRADPLRAKRRGRAGVSWSIDETSVKGAGRTTDPHPPYRRAIRGILGRTVRHRCNRYLNTLTEQSQRAIKPRDDPLLGCGSFASAARFCSAFDARRQYCRVGQRGAEWVPLAEQRRLVVQRWRSLIAEMTAA